MGKYMKCLTCVSNGVKVHVSICNCYLKVFKGELIQNYINKLWFFCSAHPLMILNICMTFKKVSLTVFMSSTDTIFCHRTASYKVQRGITKKK